MRDHTVLMNCCCSCAEQERKILCYKIKLIRDITRRLTGIKYDAILGNIEDYQRIRPREYEETQELRNRFRCSSAELFDKDLSEQLDKLISNYEERCEKIMEMYCNSLN